MIQVGKPAPDFVAPAYHKGEFTAVKLSEHLGKWVVCVSIRVILPLYERQSIGGRRSLRRISETWR